MRTSLLCFFLLLSLILVFLFTTFASAEELAPSIISVESAPTLTIEPVSTSTIESASTLTIKELQRLGLQANGLVLAAQSQVNIAEANVISAEAYPNPLVTMMAGPDSRRLSEELTGPAATQRELIVSQPIENPFLRIARIGSAEANVEANQASLDQVRANLAAQLRVSAYELLLRQELAAMEVGIFDLMEEIKRRIKVSVDVGETARFELIRADTEVLSAASRKEAALLSAQRARIALMQFTAGTLPVDFKINASLNDPVDSPPLEELRQKAPEVNPDIVRLEAEQNRARLQIDQERAAVLPSVNILYRNFQDAQFTSNSAGLNVTIPLFYRRRGEINSAISDAARIRETLEYRRFEISQLLESAWQARQIAQRRVEMLEGGVVTEAESALKIAQAAYRLGERGFIEVLDTQRVLRGVLAELLQARFELQAAAAEIDRLLAHYPKE